MWFDGEFDKRDGALPGPIKNNSNPTTRLRES